MLPTPRKNSSQPRTASPKRVASLLAAALGLLCHGAARADATDTFQPFASLGYTHESNLFLLPDDAPGFSGPRGDNARQTLAGVTIYEPLGRQIVNLSLQASRVDYAHYGELDYTGKDFSGDWEWHLANHLEGHLGASYDQSLTSFADFHGQERSLRVERHTYANGAWRFHPSWRLRASASEDKFNYDLDVQKVNDRREDLSELGLDFLAPSNSSVGVVLRHLHGIVPNPQLLDGVVVENGYTQDEIKASIDWKFGGLTQVQFLGGWARRQHQSFAYRDSSGLDGRATVTWTPRTKLSFSLVGWREFAALESLLATSSHNKGISLTGTYDMTSKLRLQASQRVEDRNFSQISGLPFLGSSTDVTHTSSLNAIYALRRTLQLNVGLNHMTRSALELINNAGFSSNSLSISAVTQF